MIQLLANFINAGQSVEADDHDPTGSEPRRTHHETPAQGDVVTALVDRLESGRVTDDQLETLQAHLSSTPPRGVEVKLDHLRSTVFDLEAYTEALREFIDHEGTAEDVLADLREEIEATAAVNDALSTTVEANQGDIRALENDVDRLTEAVTSVSAYVIDLEGRHGAEIAELDASVDRLESTIAEELRPMRSKIEDLESLSEEMRSLDSVTEEMQRISDDLDELEAFRSDLIRAIRTRGVASSGD